ncbi:hypothetical protein B0H13DRAFT_2376426 [Mycena leptocephala]|nr:hypothetical protein B0H13DRAFT_2376426 [Mycena leptocephala]
MPDDPMDHSDDESPATFNYDDVAEGNIRIDISHAGGEMADLQDDFNQELNGKKKHHDRRTRWDAMQRRVLGFRGQMKAMTNAYVEWGAPQREFGLEPKTVETHYPVTVIDVFSSYRVAAPLTGNNVFIASGLMGQGLIPCSPWTPKVAVTICLLEIYRVAHLRCPTLGIQPWLKTLADLHGTAFRPYSTQQFSTCFDVYLEILENIDGHVKKVLGHNALDWNALQAASSKRHINIVQLLIEYGADVNAQGGEYGSTLQAASFRGHIDIIQLLIEHGADVHAQGGKYGSALKAALYRGPDRKRQLYMDYDNTLIQHLENIAQLLRKNGAHEEDQHSLCNAVSEDHGQQSADESFDE